MLNSQEYEAAIKTHNVAVHAYTEVVEKYRAREVSDEVFVAAAKVKKAADAAFDIAFDAEANRAEEVVEEEDDGQAELGL